MARRRKNSNNEPSILAIAIEANWQFSAFLSAGMLAFAFFVIPLFSQNIFLHIIAGVLKPFLILGGAVFALIATIKYFRESKRFEEYSRNNFSAKPDLHTIESSSIEEHQVIHGWSKDNSQQGYAGFQSPKQPARPDTWSMELLQQIEWKLFEDLSAAYYQEKGIRAELTKLGADGGIDIKLFQDDSGNPTSLVQCKAWNSKMVGIKPIREFLGVMSHEKIAKGFFMASGSYTSEAKEFAKVNGIVLIDGTMFLAMIQRLPDDAKQRLLDMATSGDFTSPSCPSCGIKMVRRTSKKGEFWGCKNYPKCHQMLHVKSGQKSGTDYWQAFH